MNICHVCNSKLVIEGLTSGQQFRCANCHSLSRFGKVEKVATDRLAWRSLWLGISSILLLTITGIPAIYYGVRSLLRMRFVKPERRDQAAAIIGTTLGGCFGIFVGFIAVCGLMMGLINYLTYEQSTEPAEVAERCGQYFEFSSPHVVPIRASATMYSQYLFDFADSPEIENRKLVIRLAFIRAGLQPNDAVMTQQLRKQRCGKTSFGDNHEETKFTDWQFSGRPVTVTKSVYLRSINPDTEEETREETHRHYWGYIESNHEFYGMSVVFEPDTHDFSDSEVKDIFASTQVTSAAQ